MQSTRQTVGPSNEVHVTVQPKEGSPIVVHTCDGDAGTNANINALASSASKINPTSVTVVPGLIVKNPA